MRRRIAALLLVAGLGVGSVEAALDFDGTNDLVDHGDIAAVDSASALTTMLWVRLGTAVLNEGLVTKGAEAMLYTPGDGTGIAAGQSGVWERTTGNGVLAVGVWVHVAVVYDGSLTAADRIVIYRNGVAQSLSGTTPGTTLSDPGTAAVQTANWNGAGFIDADLAHLRMWSRPLSGIEIQQEVFSYRPVRTQNLLLWAPYDDGLFARDYSGQGNHGAVTQAVQVPGPPVSFGGAP